MPRLSSNRREAESVPGDVSGRASPAQGLGGPSEDETGPRPHLPRLGDRRNPRRGERPADLRGSAGTFQINGRGDKPMHLNTDDDLYYVHTTPCGSTSESYS
jgi:hypothetical protein